jgi:hypothetical protein
MIVSCDKCGDVFNDEFVSTVCPHKGIGYCRRCDCIICVCYVEKEEVTNDSRT